MNEKEKKMNKKEKKVNEKKTSVAYLSESPGVPVGGLQCGHGPRPQWR